MIDSFSMLTGRVHATLVCGAHGSARPGLPSGHFLKLLLNGHRLEKASTEITKSVRVRSISHAAPVCANNGHARASYQKPEDHRGAYAICVQTCANPLCSSLVG